MSVLCSTRPLASASATRNQSRSQKSWRQAASGSSSKAASKAAIAASKRSLGDEPEHPPHAAGLKALPPEAAQAAARSPPARRGPRATPESRAPRRGSGPRPGPGRNAGAGSAAWRSRGCRFAPCRRRTRTAPGRPRGRPELPRRAALELACFGVRHRRNVTRAPLGTPARPARPSVKWSTYRPQASCSGDPLAARPRGGQRPQPDPPLDAQVALEPARARRVHRRPSPGRCPRPEPPPPARTLPRPCAARYIPSSDGGSSTFDPGAETVRGTWLWYWSERRQRPGPSSRLWVARSGASNGEPRLQSPGPPVTGSGITVAVPGLRGQPATGSRSCSRGRGRASRSCRSPAAGASSRSAARARRRAF